MTLAIEWTRPGALWALLLAIPLAALSLYRLKRRRVVVAFLPLLEETATGARAWSGWRRLTEVGSLVARVLALGAVVVALAGPRPDRDPRPPETLVVVLDADVTTRARESEEQDRLEDRFARQVALAKAHVRAHRRGPVAVVVAGAAPSVAFPLGDDRDAAVAALDRAHAGAGPADLRAASEVAVDLARRSPPGRVLVVTSRALPALPADENPVPIEAVGAGIASDDQGIVDQVVVPAPDGVRTRVTWEVKNFGAERRVRRIEATIHGETEELVGAKDLTIEPGATVDASFDVLPPREGGHAYARLVSDQALPGSAGRRTPGGDVFGPNDLAAVRLDPPVRPSVLVVHGGAVRSFVTAVLDALGPGVDREGSGAVAVADLGRAPRRDVTIVDGVALPKDASLAGPTLFLGPLAGEGLPFRVGPTVEKPLVWRARADHPLLRGVDLATAYVARATPVEGAATGLAFADDAVVVGEGARDGHRWIAFGLDPDGSDLPLRAALPVLIKNAIRLLAERPAHELKPFYRAGEPVLPRTDVPLGPGASTTVAGLGEPWLRHDVVPTRKTPFAWGDPAPALGAPGLFHVWTDPPRGPSFSSVSLDLDPARDVTPVRPPSPAPPPAPADVDPTPAWRRALVLAALALLVLDLLLVLLARRGARGGAPLVGVVPLRG